MRKVEERNNVVSLQYILKNVLCGTVWVFLNVLNNSCAGIGLGWVLTFFNSKKMDEISTTSQKMPQGQSLQVKSWAVKMWQTTYFCCCTNFIPFKSLNLCFLFLQLSALLTAYLYERVTQVSEIPNCSSFSNDTFFSLVCITSAADYLERGMLGTSVPLQPEQIDSSEECLEICVCETLRW